MKKGLFIGALVGGLLLGATFGCFAIFSGEEGIACVPLFFLSTWLVFLDIAPPEEWGLIGVILFWSFNIVLYSIIGGIIGWFLRKKGNREQDSRLTKHTP
ncbi:MAG: hypothetical protein HYT77_09330 [Deltaproteobacteria bacterium]|nr:hypothetical protein [Deltaproteobacteria bacterium]